MSMISIIILCNIRHTESWYVEEFYQILMHPDAQAAYKFNLSPELQVLISWNFPIFEALNRSLGLRAANLEVSNTHNIHPFSGQRSFADVCPDPRCHPDA